jgi:predicted oxidoreductase (fatty acid repression mutant protein)
MEVSFPPNLLTSGPCWLQPHLLSYVKLTYQNRRSYYGIKKECPISDAELEAIVKRCVKHSPTSFNMQSSRAVLLTGKHHELLWEKIAELSDKNTEDEGASF